MLYEMEDHNSVLPDVLAPDGATGTQEDLAFVTMEQSVGSQPAG